MSSFLCWKGLNIIFVDNAELFYITSKVLMFPSVAVTKSSIIETYLTVYVNAYHISSVSTPVLTVFMITLDSSPQYK